MMLEPLLKLNEEYKDKTELLKELLYVNLDEGKNYRMGIALKITNNPEWDEKKKDYIGGYFTLMGVTILNNEILKKELEHQCRVGRNAGFEGARFALENITGLLDNAISRGAFQIIPHTLYAIKKSNNNRLDNEQLREKFYELLKEDLTNELDYDNKNIDVKAYNVGLVCGNLLNMELTRDEEEEITRMFKKEDNVLIEKILNYNYLIFCNGINLMTPRLRKIMKKNL